MRKFFFLLVCLVPLAGMAQTKSAVDSLKNLLAQELPERQRIKALIELSWEYRFINADSARTVGLQALELAKKNNLKDYEVEALHNIGITHEAQGNYTEALEYEMKALKFRQELGDDAKTANTLNNIGIIYDEQGNYTRALEYYHEARKIYERLGDRSKIGMVLVNMAIVLKAQEEYSTVVKYYREALSIYTSLNNKFGQAVCYANLGSVYYYVPDYDSALHFSLMAVREFKSQNIRQFLPNALANAGMAYNKLGNTQQAKSYLQQAITLNQEYDNKKELAFTNIYLAEIYFKEGELDKAEAFVRNALQLANQITALKEVMDARRLLADIYAARKDFKNAFESYRAYAQVKDSLFRQDKAKQIAQLQTEYETVKKENQILQLTQANETKETQLTQSWLVIILLVVVLIGIITFGLLWKNRITLKQQAELRETQLRAVIASQEEERKRFAADLHDGFGQMISALRLSLSKDQIDMPTQNHALGVLNEMNIEIRNIAFNLMPQVLMKSGLDEALKEFASRINRSGGVAISVQTYDVDAHMQAEQRIALYRICQEWVNNVIKYSQANQISIQLVQHPDELVLTIEDNGRGFDPNSLMQGQGNGWNNINSRLHVIKGSIEIDTQKDRVGTTMIITVPMQVSIAA